MVTRILFDPRRDLPTGATTSSPVTLEATPTGVRENGAVVIYPTTLTFTINTAADIFQLPANTASNAWTVVARQAGVLVQQRTMRVPDQASIAWASVPDVDPASLQVRPGTARQWDATFWALMNTSVGGGLTDAGVAALVADLTTQTGGALAATYRTQLGLLPIATTSVAPTVLKTQPYNASAGSLTPVLPALAGLVSGYTIVGVQKVIADSSLNTVTVTCAGSDTLDTGSTTLVLRAPGEIRELQVVTLGGVKMWKVIGGNTPLSYFDNTFALKPVALSQAAYDALPVKNPSTIYLITT